MKVDALNKSDKDKWSELYHGYAGFYEMEMNQDILDTVWSWIHNSELKFYSCLLYTSPSPRDLSTSRMPSSA